jgi:hypothetical protein
MRDSKPAVAARLQLLRQAAREDAERDIACVRDWQPGPGGRRVDDDLMFVLLQVLTVAEELACRRPAGF